MAASTTAEKDAIEQSQLSKRFSTTDQVIYHGLASTIFLGVDKDTSLQVGIKAVMKRNLDSSELKQALREIELHSNIPPHPLVVRLMASEETPTALLLVTPYTPHGDLWEIIRYGQTYCEIQVRNLAGQFLAALHHIHATCDLIHGDIKPQNFLMYRVDGRHSVRLCDFGLADHPETPGGKITFRGLRGTSGWFAPEVLASKDYDCSIDLFACGLILFRMLGGYPPFDPPSDFRIPLEFDERYWCHTSMACRQFLATLLSLEPRDRGTAHSCSQLEWVSGAPPPAPSDEIMARLTSYGAPPDTKLIFWEPKLIPSEKRTRSYAELHTLMAQMDLEDDDDDMDLT
eukprot:TRINITY_DN45351_c0_g1_i1.p1 TRINITY_DN45351_c0_g1~~TRINITY_DN45351_c0_g1_i1.p1  ORF type:complete len:344 (-),score=40.63 TRINITY_DN45351_c0_g1_i1:85-1116(-)